MTKAKRKRIYLSIAILICFSLVLVSSIILVGKTDNTASAYVTLPSGAINNLYDSTKEVFVKANLNSVAKAANYKDIDAMIKGVVTNDDVKDASDFATDTTIKLGTYYNLVTKTYQDLVWIPVYLSKDKTGTTAVLTLWLASVDVTGKASNQERSTWTDGTYATSYTVQKNGMIANSYDGSYIRNVTLNNGSSYLGKWGSGTAVAAPNYTYPTKDKTKNKFVDFTTGALSGFMVTPSKMPWQMAQDMLPNDPSWQGSKVNSSFSDQVLNCYPTSWTQDKIWLPAIDDFFEYPPHTCRDLWKCSKEQKTVGHRTQEDFNNGDTEAYYRTVVFARNAAPNQTSCQRVSSIYEDWNEALGFNIDNSYGACVVRPAIHLNLNAASDACAINAPVDVSVVGYTGLEQNFSSLTKFPDWYDKDVMTVEFEDGSTGKIDSGEYDMIATITQDAAKTGLKFKGDPGTGETEISRKFKFKIPKKRIAVSLSLNNNVPQASVADGVIFSGDTEGNERAPVFDFDYKDRVSNAPCAGYPTGIIGKYTATVKITNDCNYTLATTYTMDFEIERDKIDKPSIAIKEKDYTGKDITFNLSQYTDNADKITVTVTSANGKSASHSGGVITVRDVDTYTVRIALADNGVATCWKPPTGTTLANDDIGAYSIEIKVKPKRLTPAITCSDTDASWDAGETPTMTITDDRLSDSNGNKDNIDYYIYYLKSGDSAKHDDIDKTKQVGDSGVTVTMPSDLAIGGYTLVVELRKNSASSHNGNYYIDGDTVEMQFAVVGRGISITPDAIKWKVNNEEITTHTGGKLQLTYNGRAFKFSIDESNLQSMGVKVDVSKGTKGYDDDIEQTAAGTGYKVTIWLCNYDNTVATYSGSFSLHYDIQQAKYDMSNVKWNYTDGALKYNGSMQSVTLTGLPSTLTVEEYDGNSQRNAKQGYIATVLEFNNTDSNYITPLLNKSDTYEGDFDWTLTWSIGKGELTLEWASTDIGKDFKVMQVTGTNAQYVDAAKYKYYKSNGASVGDEISLDDIVIGDGAVRYWVEAVLTDNAAVNYEISETSKLKSFKVGSDNEKITVELSASSFTYDGNAHGGELRITTGVLDINKINKTYYKGSVSPENKLDKAPTDAGDYIIVLSLSGDDEEEYALAKTQITYSIAKAQIKAVWDNSGQIPEIANLSEKQKAAIGYIYYDEAGNELPSSASLEAGKSYKVKAILTGANVNNYEFVSESGEVLPSAMQTEQKEFTVKSSGGLGNNVGLGEEAFNEMLAKLKEIPLWQIIAGVISIILTIIFLSKTVGYDNKRKKFNKNTDKLTTAYAWAFLGLAMAGWTAIACVLMALAVVSLIIMLIAKSRCNKAEEEYEDQLEEYNRNKAETDERKRDESMRMMLMGMMGGNANGGQGFAYAGQGISADEMRLMINDAVTAMLPSVQQYLPQQASTNDEAVQKLIEQNEKLMKKIAEQPTEKVFETVIAREVASANANDETIKQLLRNQETIMDRLRDLSVAEKVVEKPVEKIVEKEIRVEVPVEKVVEKEIVKEVKVEVPVEKVVASVKSKKEVAPRLTLDEAYAQLSKQQQKYFDGLRQYALTKDKCKEKKSTYYIVFGQSTVNPLMKLTIKKDMVVALFKMEDEYLKDIKRDASGDGTKIKVKETEVIISDAQACKAAKNMIDLREDQIERYNDLLKEQRAMKRK